MELIKLTAVLIAPWRMQAQCREPLLVRRYFYSNGLKSSKHLWKGFKLIYAARGRERETEREQTVCVCSVWLMGLIKSSQSFCAGNKCETFLTFSANFPSAIHSTVLSGWLGEMSRNAWGLNVLVDADMELCCILLKSIDYKFFIF